MNKEREDSLCHYLLGTVLGTLDLYVGCTGHTDHWVSGVDGGTGYEGLICSSNCM